MKKNTTALKLTAEQRKEIIELASLAAIEQYHKEAERAKKAAIDKRLRNTKLLLDKYRGFVIHSKSAVYEASQVRDDLDFETLLDIMGCGEGSHQLSVNSIRESAAYTRVIVHHVDRMMEYYKYRCESSPRPEDMRRYRVIYYSYLVEEGQQKSFQMLADDECVDISTIYKDHRAAIRQLSALIFGYFE